MKYYAHIPEIKHGVVFSDPSYDADVWCQYRKEFKAKDWVMKLDINKDDGLILLEMSLGRPDLVANVKCKDTGEETQISFPGNMKLNKVELGIDTARIFCGTQDRWNDWGEEASVYTGADGMFGTLMAFTPKGARNPAGYLLFASIDEMVADVRELFQTLCSSFEGKEISPEKYQEMTQKHSIDHIIRGAQNSKETDPTQHSEPSTDVKGPER